MRKVFLLLCLISPAAWTLDIATTRMTGQYPVECAPIIIEYKGQPAVLAVNRAGQVMLWSVDGKDLGPGPDGIVAQLPKGEWSLTPTPCGTGASMLYAFCNGDGHVVALDQDFKTRWEYDLGAKTNWGTACAVAVKPTGKIDLAMCWADMSGRITCLGADGKLVWKNQLEFGECKAPLQTFGGTQGVARILAASGTRLCCLESDGSLLWARDLGGAIISRSEVFELSGKQVILCGAGAGSVFALTTDGEIVWKAAVGDEIDSTIALLPRQAGAPLILCRGVWGNLYAFDENGRHVWTHLFRAKSRSRPLVFDADGDGNTEILCTAYNQHAYLFDQEGRVLDDLRLGGCINGAPVLITDATTHRTDVLIVTAALLAQRIRSSAPRSPYASTPAPDSVSCNWHDERDRVPGGAAVVIRNPKGALLNANLELVTASGERWIRGCLTARSMFEIPFPPTMPEDSTEFRLIVTDAHKSKIIDQRDAVPPLNKSVEPQPESTKLAAWPTPAYGLFDETRLAPCKQELALCGMDKLSIPNLYVGETEAGAFVVTLRLGAPCRVRIDLAKPVNADGKPFGGAITLYEVVSTGTVNGEPAPDALIKLNDANIALLSSKRSSKFWVSVNADVSEPGEYNARIAIQPLRLEADPVSLGIYVRVLPLRIKKPFPLRLCTWDYIPNNWFPDRTTEVLDDMVGHGVNVFPRTNCIPKSSVDENGQLTLDTSSLDAELKRLEGRGQILIQLGVPVIAFPAKPSPEQQHAAQIEYLHQLRDHLKGQGWDRDDYAFYPVDEPGLGYGGSVSALVEAATLFREADPQFRIYTDPVPSISKTDFERIEPLIDVWCPNMRLVSCLLADDPRMKRIRDSGKTVWSYECVSQVRSISPLRYNRAAAWRAHFFGLSGIGFWTFSTTEVNHWLPGKGTNDEYALVYPGALPVPSIRWEAVRDGLEDIAAATILEEAIASHGAESNVVKESQEALRTAEVDMMELSDEAFIESRDYLRQGDRTIPHTWTDIETYASHRDRIARLTMALKE